MTTRVTEIRPTGGWRGLDLRELWAYRELLYVLAERDIKVRYKQTILGAGWAIIQPVTTMVLFSFVFGRFAKMPSDGVPYPIFVYAAMLPWQLFSGTLSGAANSMLNAANLISKVYFPRLILPLSALGTQVVDFLVASTVLIALMVYFHIPPTLNLLAVPVLLLGTLLVSLGVGTLISGFLVRYRDLRQVVLFGTQLWLYATPIVYPPSIFPERIRPLLFLNPMSGLIDGFRSAFLGKPFDWSAIAISMGIGGLFFLAGIFTFVRLERQLADIL